jgi:solute carrier family 25 (adenine nucleotide translocator) protein 4/5/6/31
MPIFSGGVVGTIGLLVVYPLDMARTRFALDVGRDATERQFTGVFDCLQKIYDVEGFGGFYHGLGCSIVGIIAYRALYFGYDVND